MPFPELAQPDSTNTEQVPGAVSSEPQKEDGGLGTEAGNHNTARKTTNTDEHPLQGRLPKQDVTKLGSHRSVTYTSLKAGMQEQRQGRCSEREAISSHEGKSMLNLFHGKVSLLGTPAPPTII